MGFLGFKKLGGEEESGKFRGPKSLQRPDVESSLKALNEERQLEADREREAQALAKKKYEEDNCCICGC